MSQNIMWKGENSMKKLTFYDLFLIFAIVLSTGAVYCIMELPKVAK
jgi:hypothetical protein